MKLKDNNSFNSMCSKFLLIGKDIDWINTLKELEFNGDISKLISKEGIINIKLIEIDSLINLSIDRLGNEAKIFRDFITVYIDGKLMNKNTLFVKYKGLVDIWAEMYESNRCTFDEVILSVNSWLSAEASDVFRYRIGDTDIKQFKAECIEIDGLDLRLYRNVKNYTYYKLIQKSIRGFRRRQLIVFWLNDEAIIVYEEKAGKKRILDQIGTFRMSNKDNDSNVIFNIAVGNLYIAYTTDIHNSYKRITIKTVTKKQEYGILLYNIADGSINRYNYNNTIYPRQIYEYSND